MPSACWSPGVLYIALSCMRSRKLAEGLAASVRVKDDLMCRCVPVLCSSRTLRAMSSRLHKLIRGNKLLLPHVVQMAALLQTRAARLAAGLSVAAASLLCWQTSTFHNTIVAASELCCLIAAALCCCLNAAALCCCLIAAALHCFLIAAAPL